VITVEQRGDLVALVVDGGDRVLLLDIPDAQQLVIDLYATLPNVTHEVAEALLDAQLDIADITSGRTCLLGCHQPVEDGDGKVNEVRGFVKPGKSATVLLRKPTGRVAHERCAEGAKRGGTGQQSAF
jgi:hypothetical protein